MCVKTAKNSESHWANRMYDHVWVGKENQKHLDHNFFFFQSSHFVEKILWEVRPGLKVSYLRWFLLTWEKLFECRTWICEYTCMCTMTRFWLTEGQVTWPTIMKIYIVFLKKYQCFLLRYILSKQSITMLSSPVKFAYYFSVSAKMF